MWNRVLQLKEDILRCGKKTKADTLIHKELNNEGCTVWLKLTYSVKCIPVKKNSGKKKRVRRQT